MPKFTLEGNTYELVQSRFTFGEAKAIEKATGYSIQSILNDPDIQGRADVLQAFFWISMKRSEPTLAFADLDDMDMGGIEVIEDPAPEEPADPTQPAAELGSVAGSSEADQRETSDSPIFA